MGKSHNTRGAALILTLIAIAIVAMLAAGVGTLVLGHYARAQTDQDAAKALQYAEAAMNFQVQKLNAKIVTQGRAQSGTDYGTSESSPFDVGTNASAQSYLAGANSSGKCTSWVNGTFDPAGAQDIYGKATVNGVTRYVRCRVGGGAGVFDTWALFGLQSVTMGGNLTVNGSVGTNGALSISGSASVSGQALYGSSATTNKTTPTPEYFGQAITLPTITSIANQLSGNSNGVTYFASNNDNATARDKNNNTYTLPTNMNIPNGKSPITLVGKPGGANYYITDFNGKFELIADVRQGPVNLWVQSTGDDKINANSIIRAAQGWGDTAPISTLADAQKFRLYYSNPTGALRFNGTAEFWAMLYAYDGGNNATVDLKGNATYNGAIIASIIDKSNGNATVNFPSNPGISEGEGVLFYGIQTGWQEYSPVRGN